MVQTDNPRDRYECLYNYLFLSTTLQIKKISVFPGVSLMVQTASPRDRYERLYICFCQQLIRSEIFQSSLELRSWCRQIIHVIVTNVCIIICFCQQLFRSKDTFSVFPGVSLMVQTNSQRDRYERLYICLCLQLFRSSDTFSLL